MNLFGRNKILFSTRFGHEKKLILDTTEDKRVLTYALEASHRPVSESDTRPM